MTDGKVPPLQIKYLRYLGGEQERVGRGAKIPKLLWQKGIELPPEM